MRMSWLMGITMAYLFILAWEMLMTGGNTLGTSVNETMTAVVSPTITNFAGSTSNFASMITNAGSIFLKIMSIVFLYAPTVWSGDSIWVWYFVCLPVAITMIATLVFVARGVHST